MIKWNIPKNRGDKKWSLWVRLCSQTFEQLAARAEAHDLNIDVQTLFPGQNEINWVRPSTKNFTLANSEINGKELGDDEGKSKRTGLHVFRVELAPTNINR